MLCRLLRNGCVARARLGYSSLGQQDYRYYRGFRSDRHYIHSQSFAGRYAYGDAPDQPVQTHGGPEVRELISRWSSLQPTPMSIRELCRVSSPSFRREEDMVFLRRELCIRLAHSVLELQSLPCEAAARPGVREVIQQYVDSITDFERCPYPTGEEKEEKFYNVLEHSFGKHKGVTYNTLSGIRRLMCDMGDTYEMVRPQVDLHLTRFFTARVGIRFLMQQCMKSRSFPRPGFAGALKLECCPAEVAQSAAQDSAQLCRVTLGQAPPVFVQEDVVAEGETKLPYEPDALKYMLTELFKNSCRAVVDRHAWGYDDQLPPVYCTIQADNSNVLVTIKDEGGGISSSGLDKAWAFTYSGAHKSAWDGDPSQKGKGVLAGYGVGLPLSRIYARYFGGDLTMSTVENEGTEVQLRLNRNARRLESLL